VVAKVFCVVAMVLLWGC